MTLQERLAWVEQYLGHYIETSRPMTAAEHATYGPDSGTTSRGAGVLVGVLVEDAAVHALMDWGMSWIITDDTTITARPTLVLEIDDVVKIPHCNAKAAAVVGLGTMEFPGLVLPTVDVLVAGQAVTYLVAELELV